MESYSISQCFLLEVSHSAGRVKIYDRDGRELLKDMPLGDGRGIADGLAAYLNGSDQPATGEADSSSAMPVGALAKRIEPVVEPFPAGAAFQGSDGSAPFGSSASPETIEFYRRPSAASDPKRPGRRKLWDIDHKYHCPIIGTCLTVEELRRLSKNHVWRTQGRPTDYEVHVSFVAAAVGRNTLSLATQKLLEKKYGSTVRRYQQANQVEALQTLWADSLASGEVTGALWALMTHPKADPAMLATAYEDVHMLSHQIGAGQRADLKRLTETRTEFARLQQKYDQLQRRNRQQADEHERQRVRLDRLVNHQAAECERLKGQVMDLTEQLAGARAGHEGGIWCSLEGEIEALRHRLADSAQLLEDWRQRWREGQDELQRLDAAYQEKASECQALERLLTQEMGDSCDDCPNEVCQARADLAGRLVLCVGGHKPLVEKYRQLVARCNGRFDHHDGGMEDNQRRLESMLASADAVVCAADYVSHSAYYRTKRFCKRFEKPHVLLGNSGISAFARALESMAS